MLLQAESTAGDFDFIVMGNTGALEEVYARKNFYTDDQEFFNAPTLDQKEQNEMMDSRTLLSKLPFVDFIEIKTAVKSFYKDMEPPFDVFPRWIAQTKLSNEEGTKQTSAYLVAADTMLERQIIVGHEFPNIILQQNEMITTTDVIKLLGNEIGDKIEVNVSQIIY
jgi:hypothetical protein